MDSVIQQVTNDSRSITSQGDTINYCKMPDGTLMEWGTIAIATIPANNYVEYTIDYSPDFGSDNMPSIIALCSNWSDPSLFSVMVRSPGWASVVLRIKTTASTDQSNIKVNWLAIGRWK